MPRYTVCVEGIGGDRGATVECFKTLDWPVPLAVGDRIDFGGFIYTYPISRIVHSLKEGEYETRVYLTVGAREATILQVRGWRTNDA